jgi:hypothetical protein
MSFFVLVSSVGLLVTAPVQQPPEVRDVAACVQRVALSAGFQGGGTKQNGQIHSGQWSRDRFGNGQRENLSTRIIVTPDSILVTARMVPDLSPNRTVDDAFVTTRQIVGECSRARANDRSGATPRTPQR